MDYNEALGFLQETSRFGMRLGLKNITRLLALLNNPQEQLKIIHIAGTNGKGSVLAYLRSILMASGLRVGTYSSPSMQRVTEGIRINDWEISEKIFAKQCGMVQEAIVKMLEEGFEHPTEFEILTTIAFLFYVEENCGVVILETGMGGRSDATNVIHKPIAAVITTIDFDHQQYLGNTLEEIAYEKAGIIKSFGKVVLYPQEESARYVLMEAAQKAEAIVHVCDFSSLKELDFSSQGQRFQYKNYDDLEISLLGEHQQRNAAVAIETIEMLNQSPEAGFCISETAIREGLVQAKWPGRMEIIMKDPLFLVDAAHNNQGIFAFRDTLLKYFPDRRRVFIFGVLKDKDFRTMVDVVLPLADAVYTVTPGAIRALPAAELASVIIAADTGIPVEACRTIHDAVEKSLEKAKEMDSMICSFGSIYFLGEVRAYFGL